MSSQSPEPISRLPVRLPPSQRSVASSTSVQAVVGAIVLASSTTVSVVKGAVSVTEPLRRTALHPPMLPARLHPARAIDALAGHGRNTLSHTGGDLERLIATIVPVVVKEVLDALDLNAIVRERIDLDGLVADVDIGAVIDRVDIDAVARSIDIEAIVERVDIDAIADRIDLDRVVSRLDIDAVVATVDLPAVIDRINVVGLAEEVISEIDLPEIIRDSTGSMASQVVRDARLQSVGADETLARLVDRWLRRRTRRLVDAPSDAEREPPP